LTTAKANYRQALKKEKYNTTEDVNRNRQGRKIHKEHNITRSSGKK
jgi:hypothetical protein